MRKATVFTIITCLFILSPLTINSQLPPPRKKAAVGQMVLIPAGEFRMGSNTGDSSEKPVHSVYVDPFYIDRYEVTNAQFKAFVDANPQWRKGRIAEKFHDGYYLKHWVGNTYPAGKANYPVVFVSWYAAVAYSKWAGKRLPTEAEWERAARGGLSGQKYPWGNAINRTKANYNKHFGDTTPVGKYPANAYGLHDMSGNVSEWCLDSYDQGFYSISPDRNPLSSPTKSPNGIRDLTIRELLDNYTRVDTYRVLRGGSWGDAAFYVRVTARGNRPPTSSYRNVGFRCVRPLFRN